MHNITSSHRIQLLSHRVIVQLADVRAAEITATICGRAGVISNRMVTLSSLFLSAVDI